MNKQLQKEITGFKWAWDNDECFWSKTKELLVRNPVYFEYCMKSVHNEMENERINRISKDIDNYFYIKPKQKRECQECRVTSYSYIHSVKLTKIVCLDCYAKCT